MVALEGQKLGACPTVFCCHLFRDEIMEIIGSNKVVKKQIDQARNSLAVVVHVQTATCVYLI